MPAPEDFNNFHIHTNDSNTELAKQMAAHMRETFKGSVPIFHPVHIITPNRAQHNWLKERLVEDLGFIANLEQHSLNGFFKKLIVKLSPEANEQKAEGKLIWNIFSELKTEIFQKEFAKIAEYCGNDEIKRLALAEKIAGLFKDYEQYRPDLIKNWIEGNYTDPQNDHEKWQAFLYRAAGFEENFVSPEAFERLVTQNQEEVRNYHILYLFGDLSITPLQLEYFKILRRFVKLEVHIYQSHVGLKGEKNPLAKNWGELAVLNDQVINELTGLLEKKKLITTPESNLQRIQQNILNDNDSHSFQNDDSILIYNSFSKIREVEALYNFLVKTVDEAGGKLGARDIAVYMPNLDGYIPAIKTVFDSAPHEFPYTLVSKGFSREENFWTALEQVLSFEEKDFTAPAIFNLLEMRPIQNSFGFNDLELLRKAFQDANIRRDYKGEEELETNYTSFSFGLQRLIFGFCLGNENQVEIEGSTIWPVDIAEGAAAQDLFRLHHLVELLQKLLQKKKEKRTAADWKKELMQTAEDFLQPEDWQEERFRILMENLVSLETSDEVVSFNTFFRRLKDHLQNQDVQQVKGRGGIVFSGLYPGVSMPKKVVAFLGINFEEFPRKSQKLNFDLLDENDKPGNRVEDRGAFRQAFLNAGEKMLLSYIGQNVKDNSEIPPSSLISALKDYVEKRGNNIKEIKHPLHAFNSAYFDPEKKDLFTYNGAKDARKPEKQFKDVKIPVEIQLYELENCLRDPFKHHYNKVLGIYYENPELLPEWECFDLDNLQEWKVKDRLKDARLEDEAVDLEELRKKMLLKSEIPLKNIGRSKLRETEERVDALWKKVEEIRNGRSNGYIEDSILLDLAEGQKINLNVKLEVIGEEGIFLIVSKKDKIKYELSAYIRALSLRALGKEGVLHYFCLDGNNPHHQEIKVMMTPDEALDELKGLLVQFRKNYIQILPFYPELNLKVSDLEKCNEKEGQEKTEAIRELIDNRFEGWNSFFPSEYFIREYQQGFFSGTQGESNLLELQLRTLEITRGIDDAFNKNE